MSRRKQLKPRQLVQTDFSLNSGGASVRPEPPAVDRAPVCSRCCAEFSALSDLERHQRDCSPNPPVLIVNEDEDLLSGSRTPPAASLPAGPAGGLPGEAADSFENCSTASQHGPDKSAEFMDYCSSRSVESSGSYGSSHGVPESLAPPPPGCSADQDGLSWMRSNVIIENLESTKVAVAQFSQLTPSDGRHSRTAVSSLLQQLLALQVQQIHQLQLIDQIRHQVMLVAEIPETLVICTKDLPPSKPSGQLKALSAHLSQQLAAAAGIAKCLSTQSASINDFKHFTAAELPNQPDCKNGQPESPQALSELTTTAVHKHVSKKQHTDCGSSDGQLNFLSRTKMSSLMFSKNCFPSKTSENSPSARPSSGGERAASIPDISAIVEDLDALAALAHQRKCRNPTPTLSLKESLCRRKCRFCAKVFGRDSALQIHLRSHTGERPYKCNVCGNRFSTRGNLKVHIQRHKERYQHIQVNPYLLQEHLDNIQSNAGVPAARWFDGPSSPPIRTEALIKKEENPVSLPFPLLRGDPYSDPEASSDFRSKANPTKASDSVAADQRRTTNLPSEDVKPSFNLVSKMTTTKESVGVAPKAFAHPHANLFSGFLSLKYSDSKGASDPNECVICHRILSCQSALRMHYRTHTGERPYQCKLCGRAFTTKGNLKTHQAVHRAIVPLRVQHSCPICQRRFTNTAVLQQHVHMHMQGHSVEGVGGFGDKTKLSHRHNCLDNNNGGFRGKRLSRLNSLAIQLSPSPFGKNLTDANKKTSHRGPHGELQLKWIKTERPEGSTEECVQTNSRAAAESGHWVGTFPSSGSPAPARCLSPEGQASMFFKTTNRPLQVWLDSTTLTLRASATAPGDLRLFNRAVDSSSLIYELREKAALKNTYCDICGKSFACQSALDIHYRSHTKERPFVCTTCSRGFSTKGNLKQHMLTHQMRDFPPHLFEPSNPGMAPNHSSSILSVSSPAVKTEVPDFLNCKNGDDHSGYSQRSSVYGSPVFTAAPPRRTPKQHHCKTCGKSFSSSSALQIHERTHTGERPFACAVCGRAFTTKGNLKVHMGTHMWNSATSRRGRRLSVDRSAAAVGFGARLVKLPEPPLRSPATASSGGPSVFHWSQSPQGLRLNDVCVLQGRDGLTGAPAGGAGAAHLTDRSGPLVISGRSYC